MYTVYGSEYSYFTKKLEMAMKFSGIPHIRKQLTYDIREMVASRSGTKQMPVLQTPEDWMIADSTPIIHMLDERYPTRRMFPEGPMGVFVQVVEEYFDEWISRVVLHFRWNHPESRAYASRGLAEEILPGAADSDIESAAGKVADWGARACQATGVSEEIGRNGAEDEYRQILDEAEKQLRETRFLLGDRPCAVDAVVLGGLLGHMNKDPDPRKVVQQYPVVRDWCEKSGLSWDGENDLAPVPVSTPFARFVLGEMSAHYKPFLLSNRLALAAREESCVTDSYGEPVSYMTREYPEQSAGMIGERIERLDGRSRMEVETLLKGYDLWDCFMP
jgi:glutathione S-transferase